MSRHPLSEINFTPFKVRGKFLKLDGEVLVQKGLGRARIIWGPDEIPIDLFTTHMVSYTSNLKSSDKATIVIVYMVKSES